MKKLVGSWVSLLVGTLLLGCCLTEEDMPTDDFSSSPDVETGELPPPPTPLSLEKIVIPVALHVPADLEYTAEQRTQPWLQFANLVWLDTEVELDLQRVYWMSPHPTHVGADTRPDDFAINDGMLHVWIVEHIGWKATDGKIISYDGYGVSWKKWGCSATVLLRYSSDTALAHEVGHVAGVGHVNDWTNVMNPELWGGTTTTDMQRSTFRQWGEWWTQSCKMPEDWI